MRYIIAGMKLTSSSSQMFWGTTNLYELSEKRVQRLRIRTKRASTGTGEEEAGGDGKES
jgi:hypothetical protein